MSIGGIGASGATNPLLSSLLSFTNTSAASPADDGDFSEVVQHFLRDLLVPAHRGGRNVREVRYVALVQTKKLGDALRIQAWAGPEVQMVCRRDVGEEIRRHDAAAQMVGGQHPTTLGHE